MIADATYTATIRSAFGLYWLCMIGAFVLAQKRPAAKAAAYVLLALGAIAAVVTLGLHGIG